MKVTAIIRTTETREIEVEVGAWADAREAIDAQLPEGFQVLSVRRTD